MSEIGALWVSACVAWGLAGLVLALVPGAGYAAPMRRASRLTFYAVGTRVQIGRFPDCDADGANCAAPDRGEFPAHALAAAARPGADVRAPCPLCGRALELSDFATWTWQLVPLGG